MSPVFVLFDGGVAREVAGDVAARVHRPEVQRDRLLERTVGPLLRVVDVDDPVEVVERGLLVATALEVPDTDVREVVRERLYRGHALAHLHPRRQGLVRPVLGVAHHRRVRPELNGHHPLDPGRVREGRPGPGALLLEPEPLDQRVRILAGRGGQRRHHERHVRCQRVGRQGDPHDALDGLQSDRPPVRGDDRGLGCCSLVEYRCLRSFRRGASACRAAPSRRPARSRAEGDTGRDGQTQYPPTHR